MPVLSCSELSQDDKDQLCELVRQSLLYSVKKQQYIPSRVLVSEALIQKKASFVTLYTQGNLRGCIGTYIADTPLYKDVCDHTYSSACEDPRFLPLTESELNTVSFHISILSELIEIENLSENQLLVKLKPKIDGLMLKHGGRRAIFLPSVWEQLSTAEEFVTALKQKGGWAKSFWTNDFKIYLFQAASIEGDF
ncbi:AmmeMemoRadiSam system protein A [Pseudoalteromonas sp. NBT06-2]|uniref:AmmeMemoRadiSam system protein A n=1 Tax=Pseudoalteromonas sp. NBT06-2 TaxID=2025950 RepID=UPI000BA69912|nr:AmmeMemoRadiSam system protein A [Pseudoalteromonas sp. NBT06-2]PAJ73871.1 AmmeMemoRadiSam system protein A [Pseudoalteromonas sp. NBT06-2]